MKRSTLVIAIGAFVIITGLFVATKDESMYKKKMHFNSTGEVIEQLEENPIVKVVNKGKLKEANELSECLSVRKRIAGSGIDYSKISIEEVMDISDEEKDYINKNYQQLRNDFTKRLPISSEEIVRLKVKSYYPSYVDSEVTYEANRESEIWDLVLVDEGEGFVIDYINSYNAEYVGNYYPIGKNAEENKDA